MTAPALREMLSQVRAGNLAVDDALEQLLGFPLNELPYATIDTQREARVGYPEVVYCGGKTPGQVRGILEEMIRGKSPILATRADEEHYGAVRGLSADLRFDPVSRTITRGVSQSAPDRGYIAVVTAGTSDISVAEEAAVTAEVFGIRVERIFDVGVAGLHRLIQRLPLIRGATSIVAVAGMEGALPSVLAGLVEAPVIAVPTSVGYGASFGGLAALLSILTSCATGVAVVNIDNGFGAGYMASVITRRSEAPRGTPTR
jgi:pyridinium-3,5-biscarboxylic acid mononucleotide synthase